MYIENKSIKKPIKSSNMSKKYQNKFEAKYFLRGQKWGQDNFEARPDQVLDYATFGSIVGAC